MSARYRSATHGNPSTDASALPTNLASADQFDETVVAQIFDAIWRVIRLCIEPARQYRDFSGKYATLSEGWIADRFDRARYSFPNNFSNLEAEKS